MMLGAASTRAALPMIDHALREGWSLDAEGITSPVRIVWGTEDEFLAWRLGRARGHRPLPQLEIPLETAQLILGFTAR